MKRLLHTIFSVKVSMLLLMVLAVAMAVATFVESSYGTLVARAVVYEAWWFEAIMLWVAICFVMQIPRYHLLSRGKLPIGLFHLAFVMMIVGAGITRYISKEGIVHIREGEKVQHYLTNERFIQLKTDKTLFYQKAQPIPYRFKPEELNVTQGDTTFRCVLTQYISNARLTYADGSQTFVKLTLFAGSKKEETHLYANASVKVGKVTLHFAQEAPDKPTATTQAAVYIQKRAGEWQLYTTVPLRYINGKDEKMGVIDPWEWITLPQEGLYQFGDDSFRIGGLYEGKKIVYTSMEGDRKNQTDADRVKLEVRIGEQTHSEGYFNPRTNDPQWQSFIYKGRTYAFTYAPRQIRLPFALELTRFELKRYPGSESAESYKSRVKVIDGQITFPYEIYMNHILDYKGYRFYQSSYDPDERGTLLALNKDRWGTWVTYAGYALLFIAMGWTLLSYGSRFQFLSRRLKKMKGDENPPPSPLRRGSAYRKVFSVLLFLLWEALSYGQASQIAPYVVPQEQAAQYGRLIVQGSDGRMKPLSTLSYEIVRKLTGKTSAVVAGQRLSPEQFLLALQLSPEVLSKEPLIQVSPSKQALIAHELHRRELPPQLSFDELLDGNGEYRLKNAVEEANQLKPSERSEFQKELLKVDERFNILYAIFTKSFLRIFPNKKAENHRWYSTKEFTEFDGEEADFVKDIHNFYLAGLLKGNRTHSYAEAEQALGYIDTFQRGAGASVYPSKAAIKAELFYTKVRLSNYLFGLNMLLGSILLIFAIAALFFKRRLIATVLIMGERLSWGLLLVFTCDLLLRWYIAKHPPWSDGFEMLLFVSWGVLLFGLLFARKSTFTLPLGLLFSGIFLLVSFLDWLNPEITTLKPVLHSYWLKIHVAVIVSSYAPLALSCTIALLSLLLLIFKPSAPTERWWRSMREMIVVEEMSITIGLFLLVMGTFLGGVWANESWGRYWAWDPKETWALISILVYATVAHLRLVPFFRNAYLYHTAVLWAFSVIVMTSYGVNYYLVGLHSYATGDPVPIPSWVYATVAFLVIVSVFAYFKYRELPQEAQKRLF